MSRVEPPERLAAGRLDSWKEIAAYYGKSVRTVRRWEKTEGLPVHRHHHGKGSTVYALAAELESWSGSRDAVAARNAAPHRSSRIVTAVAATWILAVGLVAGFLLDRALSGVEPETVVDLAANRRLAELSVEVGRPEEAVGPLVRVADARPDDFHANHAAAHALAFWSGDPQDAVPYVERALDAVSREIALESARSVAWLKMFSARERWLRGDARGAIDAASRVASGLEDEPAVLRDVLHAQLGLLDLSLGRLDDAERWILRVSNPQRHHELLALVVFARGDFGALRDHLLAGSTYEYPFTAVLFAWSGLVPQAEGLIDRLEGQASSAHLELARGLVALADGREDDAAQPLLAALETMRPSADGLFFACADSLAVFYRSRGELSRALELLEMTSRQHAQAAFSGTGAFWIKCQFELAMLYRVAGRAEDAHELERRLRAALEASDRTHPLHGLLLS